MTMTLHFSLHTSAILIVVENDTLLYTIWWNYDCNRFKIQEKCFARWFRV